MEILLDSSYLLRLLLLVTLGLALGSFITLASHRLVTKEPIMWSRSKCTNCNNLLRIRSLIPLISWLWQKGKCIDCKAKISCRYPLIEFFCALGFVVTYYFLGQKINFKLALYLAIYVVLIIMIVVDLEHYFIPDILQFILAFLGMILILYHGGGTSIFKMLIPAFAFLAFSFAIWVFFYFSAGMDGIGIDDFKFFWVSGFILGINNLILFMFLTGILGSIFGGLWQKFKKDETFPFAPAICFALYACLLVGKPIL